VGEGTCDGLRARDAKIVEKVAVGGMREIGVDGIFRKVGTVASGAVEMILVGTGIELGDELQVLLGCGFD